MSTASLPSYAAPPSPRTSRIPSYTANPQLFEQRLAIGDHPGRRVGHFVKESRGRNVRLRLNAQDPYAALPVYGAGSTVEGTVELSKTDGVTSVEAKIEGKLKLKEIAEGGTATVQLCLTSAFLWIKGVNQLPCPSQLPFSLRLPDGFTDDGVTYPLPPTYDVKLSGLPGFIASIEYSISVIINKPNAVPNIVPIVKSSLFGINIGNTTVSTPLVYYPRTRPAVPIPSSPKVTRHGFENHPNWKMYESTIPSKAPGGQDITTKLYIPATPYSLAAYLPYGPTANFLGKRSTRLQLMRQSVVDVRNEVILGTKTDMWRTDCIGEASFKHVADGPMWISFSGQIVIDDSIKVPGFRAAGLSVKDCLLLSMTPADPQRAPFGELRQVIPVRLATDVWNADGNGIGLASREMAAHSEYSVPSTPSETTHEGIARAV